MAMIMIKRVRNIEDNERWRYQILLEVIKNEHTIKYLYCKILCINYELQKWSLVVVNHDIETEHGIPMSETVLKVFEVNTPSLRPLGNSRWRSGKQNENGLIKNMNLFLFIRRQK